MSREIIISGLAYGHRLDLLVIDLLQLAIKRAELINFDMPSRSQLESWVESGCVQVNGRTIHKSGAKIKGEVRIAIMVPEVQPSRIEPDKTVSFSVVFEDDELVVIDKPAGVVVHPGAGINSGTLVHGLLSRFGDSFTGVGDEQRPGIVHRLDKNTSGLMVVAKTGAAHRFLSEQFKPPRRISRCYIGVVRKLPRRVNEPIGEIVEGVIDLPIGRSSSDRKKMAVVRAKGREALTHWRLQEALENGYVLELRLATGRTHQIRVHLSAVGSPLLGDPEYGESLGALPVPLRGAVKELGRQALHATRLSFTHPKSHREMEFYSPIPTEMQCLIDALRKNKGDGDDG